MKIYLAGPMRGIPGLNFPAFDYAAAKLREQGFEVFSPAEKGEEVELQCSPELQNSIAFRRKVFAKDWDWIAKNADGVALLPGWEASPGANSERACAIALGITVMELGKEYVQ
jgi:nucleoside 2-deoxyribosyltransferase